MAFSSCLRSYIRASARVKTAWNVLSVSGSNSAMPREATTLFVPTFCSMYSLIAVRIR